MNQNDIKEIVENLIQTFLYAGEVSLKLREQGLLKEIKSDNTPVSNGDLEVNKILIKKITELTPNIPIVSEEASENKSRDNLENFWLIDPIDGTKDYIKKGDEYTLNAALIIDLKPALGIVYAPEKNRLFFSYEKNESYQISNNTKKKLNCKKINKNKIIALSNSDNTPDEVLSIYKKHKVTETTKMSSSLKFCILAAGEADIYAAKARACEWDIAAGHAILIHAGGLVTDHNNEEFLYGKKDYKNTPIIAKRSSNLEA